MDVGGGAAPSGKVRQETARTGGCRESGMRELLLAGVGIP